MDQLLVRILLFFFTFMNISNTFSVAAKPMNASDYSKLGSDYFYKDDYDNALAAYSKAIELDPFDFGCVYYGNRGDVYIAKKEYDKAISDFTKGISLDDHWTPFYIGRARAYTIKGDFDAAWKDVHKIESLGSKVNPKFLEDLKKKSGRDQ